MSDKNVQIDVNTRNEKPSEEKPESARPQEASPRPRPPEGRFRSANDREREGASEREERSVGRPRYRPFFKRKVCKFCTQKVALSYRDADMLRRFTTERGKILPRRITGTCAKHQRRLAKAIKRARVLALLPYVSK